MTEDKSSYESELDLYQLYHRYEDPPPEKDWKTAALRGPALPALGNATAGAVGAAISNIATYPLSLIVARLQTQAHRRRKRKAKLLREGKKEQGEQEQTEDDEEYTNLLDAARKIYTRGGIGGFYTGLAQDTVKTVTDSFLFFLAYGFLRGRGITARFGQKRPKHVILPVLDELVIGILSGAFVKLFTTPLSNIVARKQTSLNTEASSTRDISARIKAEKGLRGFWSGYSASLILSLNPSITFFLNEFLKYALFPRNKRGKSSAVTTFLLAAISKSVALSIMYPFSMAKTRAQVDGSRDDGHGAKQNDSDDGIPFTPRIISNVLRIARKEGVSALYAGLPADILRGFFAHGFTMLAKDAVHSLIVQSYYLLLIILRKYPTPEELIQRAREQATEYAEAAREGARDLVEGAKERTDEILDNRLGNIAGMSSNAGNSGIDASSGIHIVSDSNETAEFVGDYVEDEAADWKNMYHWFWEKDKRGPE